MKNIEFFNLPLGAFFSSVWSGNELSYYYRPSIEIECVEHGCKQSFLNKLLYGKIPSTVLIRKYSNVPLWQDSKTLEYPTYLFKEDMLDIYHISTLKKSAETVIDTFNKIVEDCPVDNVVVFGYHLKILARLDSQVIVPEIIPAGHEEYHASIVCGFAGF